jgi:hypothetical protein
MRRTRKQGKQGKQGKQRKQKGGERIQDAFDKSDKAQVIHCLSQLKRFAPCIHLNALRSAQFFYNLGRLQELLKETTHPEVWWKPVETLLSEGNFTLIPAHIDYLKDQIGAEYDATILAKGC